MRTDTLFQICIYFCACMFIFNLSVSFVSAAGFYDGSYGSGFQPSNTTDDTITNVSSGADLKLTEDDDTISPGLNFGDVWELIVYGSVAGGAVAILLSWFFKDARILGVYAFGVFFWAAYLNMLSVTSFAGFIPGSGFELIFHGAMTMIFIGAVVGIITGSG